MTSYLNEYKLSKESIKSFYGDILSLRLLSRVDMPIKSMDWALIILT
ncbi:MAG: hypothetical protein GX974_02875 [Clostridiales bacterium]|nr:hypothetical protein [Clostridiales bacterium]